MINISEADTDTIVAVASGPGVGGVAVIRLSGPHSHSALKALGVVPLPKARMASLRALYHPSNGSLLDRSLILLFKAPASFTGEHCVEIHCHGGPEIINRLLRALTSLPGLRLATEGEFTRRAFENDKLDLTEAEGLNDLIHARTPTQADLALRQMDGSLRTLYENWRSSLLGYLAHLEADIEFPDEDLPEGISARLTEPLLQLREAIQDHLSDNGQGEAIRSGYRIALIGAPNAGKSTLLNRLAREELAIVTDIAGTTRDVIEYQMIINGFLVKLQDMAGIRPTDDPVEQEGVKKAIQKAHEAHHRLILLAPDEILSDDIRPLLNGSTLVFTKIDLINTPSNSLTFHVKHPDDHAGDDIEPQRTLRLSARENMGIDTLLKALEEQINQDIGTMEAPVLTRRRHREALTELVGHLDRSIARLPSDEVLAAEDLRLASRTLGTITGRVDVEQVLDRVFRDFCIGK